MDELGGVRDVLGGKVLGLQQLHALHVVHKNLATALLLKHDTVWSTYQQQYTHPKPGTSTSVESERTC